MTNWYFVIVFLSVLQLSSSLIYREYNLGKVNDITYLIKENAYSIPRHLELIMTKSDGNIQNFPISNCGVDRLVTLFGDIKLQENRLFFLRKNIDNEEKLLQIVDLSDILNNTTHEMCIPVADAFFGKKNTYVYIVEDNTVLVRWIVNSDGVLINPQEVARSENRIREVRVLSKYIELKTDSNDASNLGTTTYPRDFPRCSNMNTEFCEEDMKIDAVPFTDYDELYVDTVNETTYILRQYWYSHKMELMVIEHNDTFKIYQVPHCALDTVYAFYGNVKLRGDALFLQRWRLENNDILFQIINLPALFDNATNGTCLAIAGSYFGEDRVYIYQVEEGNTLVRSSVTPDGELADSQTIATTQNEIERITVHEGGVVVMTKANDTSESPGIEIFNDLQGCGSLENGTACKEDESSDNIIQLLSDIEEPFIENITTTEEIPATQAAKEEISESNFSFKVIVICISLLILVLVAIAYLVCSSKFKSHEKRETYSKVNAGHYNVVTQRVNADGNSV